MEDPTRQAHRHRHRRGRPALGRQDNDPQPVGLIRVLLAMLPPLELPKRYASFTSIPNLPEPCGPLNGRILGEMGGLK